MCLQVLTASAYIFCAPLQAQAPSGTHAIAVNFTVAQDSRPTTSDWPAAPATTPAAYVNAAVQ